NLHRSSKAFLACVLQIPRCNEKVRIKNYFTSISNTTCIGKPRQKDRRESNDNKNANKNIKYCRSIFLHTKHQYGTENKQKAVQNLRDGNRKKKRGERPKKKKKKNFFKDRAE